MNKSVVFKIIRSILSVVLTGVLVFSAFFGTAIKSVREYFSSAEFHERVDSVNLKKVSFEMNGKKVTVSEYIGSLSQGYIEDKLSSFQNKLPPILQGGFDLFGKYFPNINNTVDSVLSLDIVESTVKEEVFYCVDYFLQSDAEEAKFRIKNGESIRQNENLNPENTETPREYVRLYVRTLILSSVEKATGVSTDKIIILLSEKTVSNLFIIALASALLLIIINIRALFNLFLYFGAGATLCGSLFLLVQSKFADLSSGNEDLFIYYILTPLINSLSGKAVIIGVILLIIYFACIIYKYLKKGRFGGEA